MKTKQKETKQKQNDKQVLKWFNLFADYIQETNINLYNNACKYADKNEQTKQTYKAIKPSLKMVFLFLILTYYKHIKHA